MGGMVDASGYLGTFIYGFVLRMLGPFGLHHIFYLPFWTTALGGSEVINGQLVEGSAFSSPSWPTEYAAVLHRHGTFHVRPLYHHDVRLVGACLAMYQSARPENRKRVGGLLLSAALTSFLTGITEPIEFSFLFIAPALYGARAVRRPGVHDRAHPAYHYRPDVLRRFYRFHAVRRAAGGEAKTHWMYVPLVGVPGSSCTTSRSVS